MTQGQRCGSVGFGRRDRRGGRPRLPTAPPIRARQRLHERGLHQLQGLHSRRLRGVAADDPTPLQRLVQQGFPLIQLNGSIEQPNLVRLVYGTLNQLNLLFRSFI